MALALFFAHAAISWAGNDRHATFHLRSNQHVFWHGAELDSIIQLDLRGASLRANGRVDAKDRADDGQGYKAYASVPRAAKLRATGMSERATIQSTDEAIFNALRELVVADEHARRSGTDAKLAVRHAADTTIIDTADPIVVEGRIVSATIRGMGRTRMLVPSDVPPTPANAIDDARIDSSAIALDRFEQVRLLLNRRLPSVVFVTNRGIVAMEGERALQAMAEIQQARRMHKLAARHVVPTTVLKEILRQPDDRH